MSKRRYPKVVSERFPVPKRKGGGLIKIEVWEDEKGAVVKYSFAYINHQLSHCVNIEWDTSHSVISVESEGEEENHDTKLRGQTQPKWNQF